MQCKDISDEPILRFIRDYAPASMFEPSITHRSVLLAMPEGTPINLARAKMRSLIRRGLVDGCACGCRGDFELIDKRRAAL